MKTALVLGSRQQNIGQSIATELIAQGWSVVEDDCHHDDSPVFNPLGHYDLPDIGEDDWNVEALVVSLGKVHIQPLHEVADDEVGEVITACLTLPLRCIREYLRVREQEGAQGGRVVVVGSYNHDHPLSYGTAYSAAKAGLAMAVKQLAWDYTKFGYTFNIVHPTVVEGTALSDHAQLESAAVRGIGRRQVQEEVRAARQMPEALRPRDVAEVVVDILGSSRWLSGAGINMYGGQR